MAAPDDDAPRRKRKSGGIFVFILIGMIITGFAGWQVTNFSGGLRSIGAVGDREITTGEYITALSAELTSLSQRVGQPVTFAQASTMGLDAQVRGQLVRNAALDNEATRIGLSVGDARVASEITSIPAFQGTDGTFSQDAYRFTLERNNLTVPEFEARLRGDLTRQLMTGAVAGGFAAPAGLTDTLFAFVGERRGFTVLRLTEADLPGPVPAPTEEQQRAFYDANLADFTLPEARRITYVALLPADLAPTMEVDPDLIRKTYEERIDQFVQPERRLVERLVFPDQAAADAAAAALAGGASFDDLVADRGLTLTDVDLGDVTQAELGAAGAAVFALAEPGVTGVLPSDLGPALFRMNGILSASEIPYETAAEGIRQELAADAARRAIADRREVIDDALAAGATLEDLAAEQGLTLATIDLREGSEDPIAGYPAFRDAAAAAGEGDFPEVIDLDDGGIAALRFDAVVPPAPIPFDQARDAVILAWVDAEVGRELGERAVQIKSEVETGASLSGFGVVDVTPRIARDGYVDDAPPDLVAQVFQMLPGDVRVIEGPGYVGVLRLDTVEPADSANPEIAPLRDAIAAQAEAALAQDALALFTQALVNAAGVRLDEAAIAAVHAQMP
jgi:peptidyl-prolyl cis-trans isomerase D